ncbi:hypothetical protein QQP08_007786 [Theobroma cacao]|nr:hypothetical protein QQP08_007786 [Theobroma cacao]
MLTQAIKQTLGTQQKFLVRFSIPRLMGRPTKTKQCASSLNWGDRPLLVSGLASYSLIPQISETPVAFVASLVNKSDLGFYLLDL